MARPCVWLIAFALITASMPVHADPRETVRTCRASHEAGQRLRREGSLLAARTQLIACSHDECSIGLREDCLKRLDEVEAALPTIVFQARTADGGDVTDVKVVLDGTPRLSRLDGRPVEVDPGAHRVQFERANRVVGDQSVLVVEGEKLRRVSVTIASEPPPRTAVAVERTEPRAAPKIGWPTYVLGGVGVLALGSFGTLGLSGKSDRDDLYACRPSCSSDDVSAARTKFLVADVSLGVAIVALGVALYLGLAGQRK
jgi:hypothetical protein